LIILDRAVKVD